MVCMHSRSQCPDSSEMCTHHNMVGVAVAMVIPTMHEKSYIDLHNAR